MMANEIGRINRKLKAAAKRLIDGNDTRAISEMLRLAKERQRLLGAKSPQPMIAPQQHP